MAWDPEKYNEFKKERYKPFFDLVSHIKNKPSLTVLDLGCGTGELTKFLADKLSNPSVLGIDSSAEMLAKVPVQSHLVFQQRTIEAQIAIDKSWDIIFSNAALQWVGDHKKLLPQIISLLKPGGQLAIQMPSQNENVLNRILFELVQEPPYAEALHHWKLPSPVLSIDEYATILFENEGSDMIVYQKVYPVIADTDHTLFDFISGSALIPYFEKLNEELQQTFSIEFKKRIKTYFPDIPAIYAFKRIMIYAVFK